MSSSSAPAAGVSVGPVQKGPGSQNRKFKTVKPGGRSEAPVYGLRTDLTSLLWQPEQGVTKCPECKRDFGFFRRMHHCRSCGTIYCDNDCKENSEHDGERVCVNCVRGLREVNEWAKQEFAARIRRAQEAKAQLEELMDFKIVIAQRQKILEEEAENRLYLVDTFRETRRAIAMDIRNDKAKFMADSAASGDNATRRTHPVYGKRSGILRLRVKKVRNIQKVKPVMTCFPHVVVEVGSWREFTAPANIDFTRLLEERQAQFDRTGGNYDVGQQQQQDTDEILSKVSYTQNVKINPEVDQSPGGGVVTAVDGAIDSTGNDAIANEYTFEELFVFHVEDDRDGILISIVDDFSLIDVPVLLGIGYLNIRRMNCIEEPVDWDVYDENEEKKKVKEQQQRMMAAAANGLNAQKSYFYEEYDEHEHQDNNNNNDSGSDNDDEFGDGLYGYSKFDRSRMRRKMKNIDDFLLPGGEFSERVKLAEPIRLSHAAASLMKMKIIRKNGVVIVPPPPKIDNDGKDNAAEAKAEENREDEEEANLAVANTYEYAEGEYDDEDDEHHQQFALEGMEHHQQNNNNNNKTNEPIDEAAKLKAAREAELRKQKKKKLAEEQQDDEDEWDDSHKITRFMRKKTKSNFYPKVERGSATRALCDFSGHALTSAQVSLTWSFHPYKMSVRQLKAQAHQMCRGCGEPDLPSECVCADQDKEDDDEEFIKARLRQVGGEMHAIEMKCRSQYALAHDAEFNNFKKQNQDALGGSLNNNNNNSEGGFNRAAAALSMNNTLINNNNEDDANADVSSPLIARSLQAKRVIRVLTEEQNLYDKRLKRLQEAHKNDTSRTLQSERSENPYRATSAILAAYRRRHGAGGRGEKNDNDRKKKDSGDDEEGENEENDENKKKDSDHPHPRPPQTDFGDLQIPILKRQNRDHVDTCCC